MTLKTFIIKEYQAGTGIYNIAEKAVNKFGTQPNGKPIEAYTVRNILQGLRKSGVIQKRGPIAAKPKREYKKRKPMLTLIETKPQTKAVVIVTDISNLQSVLKEIA